MDYIDKWLSNRARESGTTLTSYVREILLPYRMHIKQTYPSPKVRLSNFVFGQDSTQSDYPFSKGFQLAANWKNGTGRIWRLLRMPKVSFQDQQAWKRGSGPPYKYRVPKEKRELRGYIHTPRDRRRAPKACDGVFLLMRRAWNSLIRTLRTVRVAWSPWPLGKTHCERQV